ILPMRPCRRPHDCIELRTSAWPTRLACPSREGTFEAALDRGTFHYLSAQAKRAYESELCRVLRPGGRFFLRACLRSAGVRNEIDAPLVRSGFERWREISLEAMTIKSDTRSMDALVVRLERTASA